MPHAAVHGTKPTMGLVYPHFAQVQDHLQQFKYSPDELVHEERRTAVCSIFAKRWSWCHSPMHACAYVLDPTQHGVWGELAREAAQPSAGKSPRGKTTYDEVRQGRSLMFYRLLKDDEELVKRAFVEHAAYLNKQGCHSQAVWDSAESMDAVEWWQTHGGTWPVLRSVALKVLSHPSSASGCEHNWSAYEFVHNKKRNRLTLARAGDLVYVYTNLRLVARITRPSYEHVRAEWGLCVDEPLEDAEDDMAATEDELQDMPTSDSAMTESDGESGGDEGSR